MNRRKIATLLLIGLTVQMSVLFFPVVKPVFAVVPEIHVFTEVNVFIVKDNSYTNINGITVKTRDIFRESGGEYTYGPAPDWLANGTYYSWDGVNFYTDSDCTAPVIGQYYNYYQFLPLRSRSNYTVAELDTYNKALGYTHKATAVGDYLGSALYGEAQEFIEGQQLYGVNALLILAMGYHESGSGTSGIAIIKNNLFGWGAVDSDPFNEADYFPSVRQGVLEQMGINLRGYMSVENWRFNGNIIGNKATGFSVWYATDQYWGYKIAGWAYKIDRYLGLKDYNQYEIAVLNDSTAKSVEKAAGVNATDLYTLSSSLKSQIFIINKTIDSNGLWYEIPSTMPVDDNGNAIKYANTLKTLINYNWDKSLGYINSANITIINPKPATDIDKTPPILTINGYETNLTSQGITVSASTNEGTLNATSHTFTSNGSFEFIATDTAGNVSKQTVTITNIYKKGDLNSDGKITITDLVKLSRYLAKLEDLDAVGQKAADINGDEKITITDLVKLSRCLARLEVF